MSEQRFPEEVRQDDLSVDELIRSTKAVISNEPPAFQPELPAEYADLVSDEDAEEDYEEDEARFRIPGVVKGLLYVCCVLTVSILLAVFAWRCADEVCALTDTERIETVTVSENTTISQVTDLLYDRGLIEYKWLFSLYCMISNAEEKIEPGTYELNTLFDYHALVNGMMQTAENRATVTVTIPEGYEAEDIFLLLEEKNVCQAEKLKDAAATYAFDYWFLQDLEYGDYRRLEGYLFPDTYEFYVDDAPENVLARFLRNFDKKITDEMQAALVALNAQLRADMEEDGYTEQQILARELDLHDIIIVASLVEKETTGTAESGKIAAVIYNRLCSMTYPCLNIDATVQYVLPERKDVLTNADKAVISPYNTYTNAGLPVGPIANPGMSSIRAALYPANTEDYFYVLDPEGYHRFFQTVYEYQAYLDLLLGTDEPAITEEQAMEIALEEGKKEIYQYQSWESDFSDGVLAQLQEDGVPEHLWESDWAAKDENGLPLYTGQRLWAVNLTDRNDPLTHLLIYIDAETGAVIGAGKLSD